MRLAGCTAYDRRREEYTGSEDSRGFSGILRVSVHCPMSLDQAGISPSEAGIDTP